MVEVPEIMYEIEAPEGVTAAKKDNALEITGPKGTVTRVFTHPKISMTCTNNNITLKCSLPKKGEKALIGTWDAHVNNMIKGVTKGFVYKMKLVYSHFPVKVSVKDTVFVIDNFLGEKSPRKANIIGDTKVEIKGDQITLTGIVLEDVSQSAANIELATRIKGYDPRVFQDGIYITQKKGLGE